MSEKERNTSILVPEGVRDRLRKLESYPDEAFWKILTRLMDAAEAGKK